MSKHTTSAVPGTTVPTLPARTSVPVLDEVPAQRPAPSGKHEEPTFDDVLGQSLLRCVFQPLVDLDSGETLGHEALLRGPRGTAWESPLNLLAAARDAGRLPELERVSISMAVRAAQAQSGGRPVTLFVNVEPSTVTDGLAVVLEAVADRAAHVQVVVEITERALAVDPAGVLAGAERLRAAGCAIALDDVGVEPASLAFIPILRPEIVKLDLGLLRTLDDPMTITVAGAVRAYAEVSGAEVVAEGIEVEEDLVRAMVLGATLGQGWLWGRPDETFGNATARPERFAARPVEPLLRATPFQLIRDCRQIRRAPKRLLLPISRTLELAAMQSTVPPLLLSSFQHAHHLTPRTAARYADLATRLPFVGALAQNLTAEPAPAVRGTALEQQDPLSREWTVVVLGAHESTALIAREVAPTPEQPLAVLEDGERPFDFVVTHDRDLVTAAALALVGRLTPAPEA